MGDENAKSGADAKQKAGRRKASSERGSSTVSFPYMDLDAAISVARAMLNAGGVALSRDQLAGTMGLAAGGGNFVQKVATARIFNLITYSGSKYELTDNGFEILDKDEKRQKAARAEAFLSVPLYRRAYEEFRGKQLPPRPHGLEQAFVKFGVAPKQKTNARLAFDKSAQQAGFFPNGQERLIEPIIGPLSTAAGKSATADEQEDDRTRTRQEIEVPFLSNTTAYHPFIQGLLDTLPAPETNWTVEGRAKWLQAAANIFDLIYKGTGEIKITASKPDTLSD